MLFVGRLDAEKHVHELLRAMALLPKSIHAEIVGDGSCRADLETLAGQLGITDRVRFLGFVSDEELRAAYQRCSVFCMPGIAELQSLATMEAMAAGKPVVAANAVALPHLVVPVTTAGCSNPATSRAWPTHSAPCSTPRKPWPGSARGSRRIIAAHDLGASLDAFDTIYRNALGRARPEPASAPASSGLTSRFPVTVSTPELANQSHVCGVCDGIGADRPPRSARCWTPARADSSICWPRGRSAPSTSPPRCLDRIERTQPTLNAFRRVRADRKRQPRPPTPTGNSRKDIVGPCSDPMQSGTASPG